MSDMQCPYCGADQEVCDDDGNGCDEGMSYEHDCSECDKTFVFETQISLHYKTRKADCLNGSEHELVFRKAPKCFPKKSSRMRCKDCDYERMATQEEIDIYTNF